ncbi:MAG: DoxX family protein [Candidatus Wildermuthbacteria bacterium]|nr:DoxX family protein [Candidatus Wildermuthbacteria bacterium]
MHTTLFQKLSVFLLRLTIGWMFFYAGITKIADPNWSAAGYLQASKTFPDFYQWLLQPGILPFVNFINEWGLTLLGISLILGVFVRLGSILGSILMLMYYLPILQFPYPNAHSYIVNEHIIYIAALLLLSAIRAGRIWGLEHWCSILPVCSRYPALRKLLG